MELFVISDDDPRYFYKDYKIFQNLGKKGIKNIKDGAIIVPCCFDDISWYRREDLVEFRLNRKSAFWHVGEIDSLFRNVKNND